MRKEPPKVRIWRRKLDWSATTLHAALAAERDRHANRTPLLSWLEPRPTGGARVDADALLCRGWPMSVEFELDEARLFFTDGLLHAVSDRCSGLRAIELRMLDPAAPGPDGTSWDDLGSDFVGTTGNVYTRRDLTRFLGAAADTVSWRGWNLVMREFRRDGQLFTWLLAEGGTDGR